MIKFFVWLGICTAISPILGMVYVVAAIVWVIAAIHQDERARHRRRPLT